LLGGLAAASAAFLACSHAQDALLLAESGVVLAAAQLNMNDLQSSLA